jgi:hypothetical protein
MRFVNYLINDCIYLLDEAMKLLPQVKEKEAKRDSDEWNEMSALQRRHHTCALRKASPANTSPALWVKLAAVVCTRGSYWQLLKLNSIDR